MQDLADKNALILKYYTQVTEVKKYRDIIESFINSKNESESLHYENKLLIMNIIPILVLEAIVNAAFFTAFGLSGPGVWLNSAALLAFAGILYLISRTVRSDRMVSNLIVVVFTACVFFLVWRYYQQIGPAVWTIIFIVVVFGTVSVNRLTLGVLTLSMIVIGLYIWYRDIPYEMGNVYYVAQFFAFAVLFLVALAMQQVNCSRYKKIERYLEESDMVLKISADLITVNAENMDDKVNTMLKRSGTYLGVDHAVIFLLSKDRQKMTASYEWCATGQEPLIGGIASYDVASREEWVDQIENKTTWIIPDVNELSDKRAVGEKWIRDMRVKAMISMPFEVRGRVCGLLIYASQRKQQWRVEHLKMLGVLANLLSDTFLKVDTEQEISTMAYHDALTGLANRAHLNLKLEQAIESAAQTGEKVAIAFIDLDSFKAINDTSGHEGGDEILKMVGQRLEDGLASDAMAARFGGDEFIMMIPGIRDREQAQKVVERVMNAFDEPVMHNNADFYVMASTGIALYPDDGEEPKLLIKNADRAMYAAKELGKNQIVFCTDTVKKETERKIELMNQLCRPQLYKELILDYQPLVDLETKDIVGFESLIRWKHPRLGLIQPDEFIPLAEQTGHIIRIGEWVLREACRQNKAWQDAGFKPVRMSVNVSAKQFLSPDLIKVIEGALTDSGLEARYLELELTESAAVNQAGYIPGMLADIRAMGVSIAIDDFGTEYSSLSRITQMPIDRIKMAMQFVSGISVSEKDETIAKIIINLANSLGVKIVAEGVETKTQFEFLKKRICDEVQGFYLYRPMPAAEIEKILSVKM